MKILAGTANPKLAASVADLLEQPLASVSIRRFGDAELFVEILDTVRGKDVFLIQPTSWPANDNLMELLITIDALRRGSAKRITAVIPFFGYARQDRKTASRSPITAKLVANLVAAAGTDRVLTIDLHSPQIQGFFDIPVDNLYAAPLLSRQIDDDLVEGEPAVVVSPDAGGVVRARWISEYLGTDLAIIDKRRERPGVSQVMNIIGEVSGRHCILIDDLIDTAGTICNAAEALRAAGALSVRAYATHGVFSGDAMERIRHSGFDSVMVTDSIAPREDVLDNPKVKVLSVAPLLAEAILRITQERSLSSLFK
ncbi:MAG TPA: phosphoribosylpyrophosphate synthetase [Rhodospirillaceae bacterium]|nr:MAG: phosphoribosylpyrophosphate synthetase [Alphaproteobacteria bacterium GWF2_58_20]HAU29594.1 phosphoribosylpyrophosphate synthetase [Rhodospirillaceae bacterium]